MSNTKQALDVPQLLKHYRTAAGLTQRQVCDVLGVTNTAYAQYEQGVAEPTISQLEKMLAAMGYDGVGLVVTPEPLTPSQQHWITQVIQDERFGTGENK